MLSYTLVYNYLTVLKYTKYTANTKNPAISKHIDRTDRVFETILLVEARLTFETAHRSVEAALVESSCLFVLRITENSGSL